MYTLNAVVADNRTTQKSQAKTNTPFELGLFASSFSLVKASSPRLTSCSIEPNVNVRYSRLTDTTRTNNVAIKIAVFSTLFLLN